MSAWTDHTDTINGVRLHWVEQGEGPLVLLLHGFPEFWWGWHRQLAPLAAAGFRVVAPDLRGYNLSGKPPGVDAYRTSTLAADVAALIAHLGCERAVVAGHDWGGVIAWHTAMRHPERVERLVIANAPHPEVFARELRHPRQFLRSWYALFFQLPWLPEAALRAGNYRAITRLFRDHAVRANAFSERDLELYREAISRPGALTAALNYYRAFSRGLLRGRGGGSAAKREVRCPTLVIWGEQDRALNPHNLDGLERWVPDLRVERIAEAGHWVLADAPERVTVRMLRFLRSGE
jgi:pimeloyl-ACP methyl ester carboxylesterase